jgi:hypothetical protein
MQRVFLLVPAQAVVEQFVATFKEFPPQQKPASFSVEQVLEQMSRSQGGRSPASDAGPKPSSVGGSTAQFAKMAVSAFWPTAAACGAALLPEASSSQDISMSWRSWLCSDLPAIRSGGSLHRRTAATAPSWWPILPASPLLLRMRTFSGRGGSPHRRYATPVASPRAPSFGRVEQIR